MLWPWELVPASRRFAVLEAMRWRVGAYQFIYNCHILFGTLMNDVFYLFSCHLGRVILYDTVSKLGWSASARTHGIRMVIDQILSQDWEPGKDGAEGHQVPEFVEETDCVVRVCLISFYSKYQC
jgi:hypothetical protein